MYRAVSITKRCATSAITVVALASLLTSCKGPADASSQRDGWILVTIASARIAPEPRAGVPWDAIDRSAADRDRDSLGAVAQLLDLATGSGIASTVLTAVGAFSARAPSTEVSATAPDPVVEISVHQGITVQRWSSAIVRNSLSPSWEESFFLRPADLGAPGVSFAVYDVESRTEERTEIGRVALSRDALLAAIAGPETQELILEDGALSELRIAISRPNRSQATVVTVRAPLEDGLTRSGVIVPRGAVVHVRASGLGRVGRWACSGDVGPAGHPSPDCLRYNLGPAAARAAAHGSAIVLVGREPTIGAFPIVDLDETGAATGTFIASAGGELLVGVNDRDEDNNSGAFVFDIVVMAP
ncbi:MAG: hypothetical protein H5U40_08870 [Polyangiaceae bacterium]|nr:hypothetical protein [Polyangiaceae bacterium]